jgi:hypothetical protein
MKEIDSLYRPLNFPQFLTGIFILLKLLPAGIVATWNWIWVLSPLWITFLLSFSAVIYRLSTYGKHHRKYEEDTSTESNGR